MSWRVDVSLRVGALQLEVELAGGARPLAIVGPNGAGKTTLLRTIAGMHAPRRGTIVVGERTLVDVAGGVDLPPEQRQVGYLPQGHRLFPDRSALDNVAFGLLLRGDPPARARAAATALLAELGGAHLADRLPHELSGGEQQRVALARALLVEPRLLLLDEPLAALDAGARRSTRTFLAAHLRAREVASIVVTHDPRDLVALDAELCVLEGGRVAQRGTLDELRRRPATDFVAELFGESDGAALAPAR